MAPTPRRARRRARRAPSYGNVGAERRVLDQVETVGVSTQGSRRITHAPSTISAMVCGQPGRTPLALGRHRVVAAALASADDDHMASSVTTGSTRSEAPPSARMVWPVIHRLPSQRRNTTMSAMSSG